MATMKAVRIHSYGDASVLAYEEAPRPVPGDGELLIRVLATTVNPFDVAVRSGYTVDYFNHTLPLVLGTDASGIVEAVGPGVTGFAPGDPVYARAGVYRDGTNAEYVVANAANVAAKPLSLDHTHAAALPHVSLTAWQALYDAAQLAAGQTVLIHGAAGGVGHVAVQLAQARDARVIGTASTNIDFLAELGVDQAVNYATTPFQDEVGEGTVDVVLDVIGGDTQERSWPLLKPGGMLISTVQPPSAETAAAFGVRQHFVAPDGSVGETLAEVAALVDSGQLTPFVSTALPLPEIRKAHEAIAGGHTRGKIVLNVAG